MIITIDGPVASGKSTVAKALAKGLGFCYLNTGLLYRATAYALMHTLRIAEMIDTTMEAVTKQDLDCVYDLLFTYDHVMLRVSFLGKDLTTELSQQRYEKPASMVASHSLVRMMLLDVQRDVAKRYDVIADGRDCGTVVFPQADVKFFLTASPDVRARRLFNDPKRKVSGTTLDEVKASLMQRDERDYKRAIAPLSVPVDALMVDNSDVSFEQSVAIMLAQIRKKITK